MSPIHPRTLQWRREMWSTRMVRYTFGFLWHLKTRCLETSDDQIRWVFRKWMDEIMMKSLFHPFSVHFPMAKPPGSIQRNRMDWNKSAWTRSLSCWHPKSWPRWWCHWQKPGSPYHGTTAPCQSMAGWTSSKWGGLMGKTWKQYGKTYCNY